MRWPPEQHRQSGRLLPDELDPLVLRPHLAETDR
jgi:hypothetical protein